MSSTRIRLLIAAGAFGIGVTVAASYYYVYNRIQRKKQEDTDEGIGDEDSIISDSEDPAILRDLTTPVTIAPKDNESSHFEYGTKIGHDTKVQDVASRNNSERKIQNHRTSQNNSIPIVEVKQEVFMPKHDVNVEQDEQTNAAESSDSEEEKEKKVLILGLDRAGKTALIETLTKHNDRDPTYYNSTNGFNVAQARCDGVSLNLMEVGGSLSTRKYWPNFLKDTNLLIYVMDASDEDRFDEAKSELAKVIAEDSLAEVPCLLLANKQDLKGAVSCESIISDKDLKKISANRHLKLTLLDSVCIPDANSVVTYSDTLMAVILNLLE